MKADIAIIGAGAAGLSAAIGLARAGASVVLAGVPRSISDDARSAALFNASLDVLDDIGCGNALRAKGAPLAAIRIVDITDTLLRAPTVTFRASEIGQDHFGWNIPNAIIVETLIGIARNTSGLTLSQAMFTGADQSEDGVSLRLSDGSEWRTQLLIGADGQNSPVREAAGIEADIKDYPQTALTCRLSHQRDHDDISTEFHTREGPLTFVPAGDFTSALVWVMQPEKAEAVRAAGPDAMLADLEKRSGRFLGRLALQGRVGSVPLRKLLAKSLVKDRIVLIGEAAHAFPPIGAQGLNLGLRDVKAFIALVSAAISAGRPLDIELLARYEAARMVDTKLRANGVDILNSALISGYFPGDFARFAGLSMLKSIPPLRQLAMRLGGGSRLFPKG